MLLIFFALSCLSEFQLAENLVSHIKSTSSAWISHIFQSLKNTGWVWERNFAMVRKLRDRFFLTQRCCSCKGDPNWYWTVSRIYTHSFLSNVSARAQRKDEIDWRGSDRAAQLHSLLSQNPTEGKRKRERERESSRNQPMEAPFGVEENGGGRERERGKSTFLSCTTFCAYQTAGTSEPLTQLLEIWPQTRKRSRPYIPALLLSYEPDLSSTQWITVHTWRSEYCLICGTKKTSFSVVETNPALS